MKDLAGQSLRGLHLFALFAFAVAQPLLDLLARYPTFLVAHQASPGEIVLLLVGLLVALPAAAWFLEVLAGSLSPRLARGVQLFWVGSLVACAALPVLERWADLPGAALVTTGLALGAGAALGYARYPIVRTFATALALGPLVYAGAFISDGSTSKLLFQRIGDRGVSVEIETTPPIVIVIFDELPTSSLLDQHGGIDSVRYPSFAKLARTATWYRNASTAHALTEQAIPAILTGRYPEPDRLPIASEHPRNLFTLLAGHYEMEVVETITSVFAGKESSRAGGDDGHLARARALLSDLAVVYLHVLLPGEFAASLPTVTRTWKDFRAPAFGKGKTRGGRDIFAAFDHRPLRFRQFVASITRSETPTLHLAHFPLPHYPWEFLPSGRAYDAIERQPKRSVHGAWWANQYFQRHLLQLGFVDSLLGELLSRLERLDLYDRTLLVVTADHGISFWPYQSPRDPAKTDHPEDILAVPLFIKAPHQKEGRASFENVEAIDILPTIADLLGARIPWPIDGCSALDPACPKRAQKVIFSKAHVPLTFDPELPRRRETLDRKLRLFGSGADGSVLSRYGPHQDLIGRRVEEIGVRGTAEARVALARRPFLIAAARPDRLAPARIRGVLHPGGGTRGTPHLAIAIDGEVRAVAPGLQREKGGFDFAAMLTRDPFPTSKDQIEIFAVDESGETTDLWRIPAHFAD